MAKKVRVIVLRTAGTNCDQETAFVFRYFGAQADLIHINKLLDDSLKLSDYHILAIPGGFTYGDDIESGRILANELRLKLGKEIKKFIKAKKLVIGICNGFQILVKTGILPGGQSSDVDKQTINLVSNDSGKFEDRWCYLKVSGKSVWTEGLNDIVYYPVAHAEGKFVVQSKGVVAQLEKKGQIAFRYCSAHGNKPVYPENPNGSAGDITGITDSTGRILGLMPHPERHFFFIHHPTWTRFEKKAMLGEGAKIFENGVRYVRQSLLA
ncbi:Phosphoribosylformylglycinamidine synthase, glutamine amidotransferase subunit [hydrothermal vent metagenome]|uniref:Phosphoribosylformylglycinamidine synthase, glutamine amidotransferase subunit n=1 Tax=hydrothermal vent metagenome TaxID=652676 RepID=A0A3B1D5J9_9ZZZZ